jgi:hypothetical protein
MKYIILICCLVFNSQSLVFSQVIPDLKLHDDTLQYEKLYLHIDRELYSPGDDIWFKSYLVNGINNRLIPGFRNVYVQLIAEDGLIIDRRMILSVNGVSNNDFYLPDTLLKGQYTIRAYTKFLQNFGEKNLFHQKIAVASSTDLPVLKDKLEDQKIVDVSFLPEGGNLVMNAPNYIAFKAINEKGKGIPVAGKIVDESGNEIVTFESIYKGMGTFVIMPQEGSKYKALLDGYPGFEYTFDHIQIDGVALHYREKENYLEFILSRNIKSNSAKNLVLTVSYKGEELFHEEVEITGIQHPVEIYKGFFPPGISKITVSDAKNEVLAERLVFVRNSNEKILMITSDKTEYQAREKIELKIESLLNPEEDSIVTGLSVAVVNEDYFSEQIRSRTIESYLLLDSELKGPLELPASFFIDEENITADEKLDLVMMVNGWRRYFWDDLEDFFSKPLNGWADVGLKIKGEVKTVWGEKPLKDGIVELGPFSSQFLILRDTTDDLGRFNFDRLYLKDSALIMLNVKNHKGKNENVEIFTDSSLPVFDLVLPFGKVTEVNQATIGIEIPEKFERSAYSRYLAEREFKLEEGSILLKEVEVKAKFKSPPNITGVYGFADRSYTPTDADRENYPDDIMKYLEFEIPGILNTGDGIRIGFAHEGPLIYVDGYLPTGPITMNDIVKIEIIQPQWRHFQFNVTGAKGGVISILTKTGFGKFNNEFVRNVNGRVTPLVRGFRQAREFYSPQYPLVEQNFPEQPDQRPTLHWEPYVVPVSNKAKVEFHASDMTGKYRVIAEGISSRGKIIQGSAVFEVVANKDK